MKPGPLIIALVVALAITATLLVSRPFIIKDPSTPPPPTGPNAYQLIVQSATGAVAKVIIPNGWLSAESRPMGINHAATSGVCLASTALRKYEERCRHRDLGALTRLYAPADTSKLQTFLADSEASNHWASFNLSVTRVEPIFGMSEDGLLTTIARVSSGTGKIVLPYQIDPLGYLRVADLKSPVVGMFLQHSAGIASGQYHLQLEPYE